jgi:hypothetical protein
MGAVQHPDCLGAADRGAVAVAPPTHVDDRDVEVADIADQVESLLAGLRLMDDEAAVQGLTDPDPDERVTVDYQAMWGLAQG